MRRQDSVTQLQDPIRPVDQTRPALPYTGVVGVAAIQLEGNWNARVPTDATPSRFVARKCHR